MNNALCTAYRLVPLPDEENTSAVQSTRISAPMFVFHPLPLPIRSALLPSPSPPPPLSADQVVKDRRYTIFSPLDGQVGRRAGGCTAFSVVTCGQSGLGDRQIVHFGQAGEWEETEGGVMDR